MSGHTPPERPSESWRTEVRNDAVYLDVACRRRWGVGVTMFRALKYAFYIAVLVFTVYLIEATPVSALVATAVGVLLISGPEGLELYLVREGYLAERDRTRDRAGGGDDDRGPAPDGGQEPAAETPDDDPRDGED